MNDDAVRLMAQLMERKNHLQEREKTLKAIMDRCCLEQVESIMGALKDVLEEMALVDLDLAQVRKLFHVDVTLFPLSVGRMGMGKIVLQADWSQRPEDVEVRLVVLAQLRAKLDEMERAVKQEDGIDGL